MKQARSGWVWGVVGLVMALALGLLWMLQVEPQPELGLGPAEVEVGRTTPAALHEADAVAAEPAVETPLADRELAAVEAALEEHESPSWVEGVVVHAGGEGTLAGIELEVWARVEPRIGGVEPESTHWVAKGSSGDDGRFALPRSLIPASWYAGSAPQVAILRVQRPGFARFQAPFPPLSEEPAKVLVGLEPSSVLLGRVVRAESGPLAHAKLVLEVQPVKPPEGAPAGNAFLSQLSKVANTTSDSMGRFRLEVRDGPMHIVQGPLESIRIHINHTDHGEARVELPANKLAELRTARGLNDVDLGDLVLDSLDWTPVEAPLVLAGQLVDPEGVAIRGHNLRIQGDGKVPADKPIARTVGTDAEGNFSTVGLHGERIAVRSLQESVRVALEQGDGIEVEVKPGEPVQVVWPMHRVRPRLVDPSGTPIQGANVHLVSKGADRSQSATASGTTLADGIAQDFYAPPGERVQIVATLPLGQAVRATVNVPDRPYLTTVDLVRDDSPPGTLRLTLEPPLTLAPSMAVTLAQGGAGGVALQFADADTHLGLSVGRENPNVLGPGRADVTLAPGSYRLQLARLPEGYAPLREPLPFAIVSGETLELTVPVERSALLHLVPLDPSAVALLGRPIVTGTWMSLAGETDDAPEPAPGSPAPLLVWNPTGAVREGPYRMRAEHLPAGRYAMSWRWKDGEQWIGEIELQSGVEARVELAGPAATEEAVGRRWLSLERR